MRARRITEIVGALAGAWLLVLVFLPWWVFDPASAPVAPDGAQPAPETVARSTLGFLSLYSAPDASAWDGLRHGAIIWLITGVLAAGLGLAPRLGLAGPALRALRCVVLAAALVALAIAVVRLVDPPFAGYRPAAAAYAGTVLMAAIGMSAAAGLRRA